MAAAFAGAAVLDAAAEDDKSVEFFRAAAQDDRRTVEALLLAGYDPNTRNPDGQVALFVALQNNATKVADLLMGYAPTEIDALNRNGETPLMMAALKGNLGAMRTLIAKGARVQEVGWCALHYAATGGNAQAVELLLKSGADVNAKSPNASTPLMMAARYGSEAAVGALLKAGAQPALRNQKGLSAADFARLAGRNSLAESLDKTAWRLR